MLLEGRPGAGVGNQARQPERVSRADGPTAPLDEEFPNPSTVGGRSAVNVNEGELPCVREAISAPPPHTAEPGPLCA